MEDEVDPFSGGTSANGAGSPRRDYRLRARSSGLEVAAFRETATREGAVMETAKTIALWVLAFLYVVLALHRPEVPRPDEHPVELSPAYVALKTELARANEAAARAQSELRAYKAAAAAAALEKERETRWAAAADAEARGALRTASKLYDDYARSYPDSKQAALATRRAAKLLADFQAKKASVTAEGPAAPATNR